MEGSKWQGNQTTDIRRPMHTSLTPPALSCNMDRFEGRGVSISKSHDHKQLLRPRLTR